MAGRAAGSAGAGTAGQSGGSGGLLAGTNGGGQSGRSGESGRAGRSGHGGSVSAGGGDDAGESGAAGSDAGGPPGAGGVEGNAGGGGHDGGSDNAGSAGAGGSTGAEPAAVLILLDRSSSMFEGDGGAAPWDLVRDALMAPEDGAVSEFEDEVEFGFATFSGYGPTPETDPSCAEIASVGFASGNHDAIAAQFELVTPAIPNVMMWQTPTGHAVNRTRALFDAYGGGGRKYLLLLTDGNPNTCGVLDPQCGQDLSVEAVQDARAAGITTLVLGFGTLVHEITGCPLSARCGDEHLQDLANAGVGFGVTQPSSAYQYELCVQRAGGLQATYTTGGSARFYSGSSRDELRAELVSMLTRIVEESVP
jgi:hypothetical protein